MGILSGSTQEAGLPVVYRRLLVLVLNAGTTVSLLWAMYQTLSPDGITSLEAFILVCTAYCFPWPVITFWNAIISLFILAFGNPAKSIYPYFDATGSLPKISSKTALTFCLRNEDPKPLFRRLYAMQESLRNTGHLQCFRFVLLSDTSDPGVAKEEEEGFAQVRDDIAKDMARPPVYRRRCENTGYKAGNVKDYLDHHSSGDEFFVTLDQDSVMGGDLLVRMVSSMEKHPKIGLLQTLCVGMPAVSAFTRLFQFGIRHSTRTYSLGNSWWTDDCALYWGHNAIIRTAPFHKYCMLPKLPGNPPLGGYILSHDLMEAMFMRRAGYEVRLVPIETESYETQPPTLIDYLRRELRWCQGTMQYWFLLREPGLLPISRFQVYQTLATYLHQAVSVLLAFASIANALQARVNDGTAPVAITFALPSLIILFVSSGCKIAGILDTTLNHPKRYGGMWRWTLSIAVETLLIVPLNAVTSMAVADFLLTLLVGKTIPWDGQNRDRLGLHWRSTFGALWPQTLIGIGTYILLLLYCEVPVPWASTWAISLALAVPFAVFTASPWFGCFATRWRWFMIPEEARLPRLLSTLVAPEIKPLSVENAIKSTTE